MNNKKNLNGFSLVELLIVVAIIGILAAVAVPAYYNHILRTRQADAYHNLLDLKSAQEMYYAQYNKYGSFADGGTFSNLLSFDAADSLYYGYRVTVASTLAFTGKAVGKYKKLNNNIIRITESEDPCIEAESELKMSLGLEPCP